MTVARRVFLAGLAGGLVSCVSPRREGLDGGLEGPERARRGHRVRQPVIGSPRHEPPVDVVIVGGGVAGLSASWRLRGAGLSVLGLELGDHLGGTARAGDSPAGPHPLGAHYITLPNPEARAVRRLLGELGVIEAWSGGRPRYRGDLLAWAPQERLFVAGRFCEGLWPAPVATAQDDAQREAFEATTELWRRQRGEDGLRAFEIPVHRSSRDPAIRALASESFEAWLDERGFDSPLLRWYLRYCLRDDCGVELHDCSAWAGLHYFCARQPDPATPDLGTDVLTWPAGNGWLVRRLAERGAGPWRPGCVVRAVQRLADGVEVWFEQGELRSVRCRHAVLAVPSPVANRLTGRSMPTPEAAPWVVASLLVDRLPSSVGLGSAWDTVRYGSDALGYVLSTHQGGRRGPAVLSWFDAGSAGEPREQARTWLEQPWEQHAQRVLDDLAPAHRDIRQVVRRLDVTLWGHGTTRPTVGLHGTHDGAGPLDALLSPLPGVSFAHADQSGISLFEEANFHGVRAAEEALSALGRREPSWL